MPTWPENWLSVDMNGFGVVTENATPLLATPPTVTTALPDAALGGTAPKITESLQLAIIEDATPLNVTVLVPCRVPKPVPVMRTSVSTGPDVGVSPPICRIVKFIELLPPLAVLTITGPLATFIGTGTTMLVSLQLVGVAEKPLKVTVPVPCEAPKLEPVIVTGVSHGPRGGLKLATVGGGGRTVIVAVPDFVGSVTDVAVRITVDGLGTTDGAV